jgi:molybdopterin-guanine dinucleotide biosynthesis protein A
MIGDHEWIGAIVLAGGRSSRFGRDKLSEPVDGRPLLHHAIAAVRALTDEIIVVAAPYADPPVPEGITLVHDLRPFEGPLAALDAGLAASPVDRVIVVAGDMPTLVPAVLGRLIAALGADADAAILEVDGPRANLPLALTVEPASAAVRHLVDAGERRLGALLDVLDVLVVPSAEWRLDDPDGLTLRDIDTPADLHREGDAPPSR